jgi:chromosome segregation ATPase
MATATKLERDVQAARRARDTLQVEVSNLDKLIESTTRAIQRLEQRRAALVVPANAGDGEARGRLGDLDAQLLAKRADLDDVRTRRGQVHQDLERARSALAEAERVAQEDVRARRIEELEAQIEAARASLQECMDALLPQLESALAADRDLGVLTRTANGPIRTPFHHDAVAWLQRNLGTVLPQDFNAHHLWSGPGAAPRDLRKDHQETAATAGA